MKIPVLLAPARGMKRCLDNWGCFFLLTDSLLLPRGLERPGKAIERGYALKAQIQRLSSLTKKVFCVSGLPLSHFYSRFSLKNVLFLDINDCRTFFKETSLWIDAVICNRGCRLCHVWAKERSFLTHPDASLVERQSTRQMYKLLRALQYRLETEKPRCKS